MSDDRQVDRPVNRPAQKAPDQRKGTCFALVRVGSSICGQTVTNFFEIVAESGSSFFKLAVSVTHHFLIFKLERPVFAASGGPARLGTNLPKDASPSLAF